MLTMAISLLLLAFYGVVYGGPIRRQAGAATTSPPWYPSPKGGTAAGWQDAYNKAQQLVSGMTLVEKVNITTGTGWSMGPCVGNTGAVAGKFPALCLQDGPTGVRWADLVTAFPPGITTGMTWDKQLIHDRGAAMGVENRGKGINTLLGPAMGPLGKFPAGGRNWEGFGSDPYLQGKASAATVEGIQEQGVMATAKHYVGNEQEHHRQGRGAISANIDDRTLHEIYGWPFQDSVKAGVASIMCAYNKVNNSAACGNAKIQNGILKDEFGFQGFIMADWTAQMSGVGSILAGLDMTMPGDGIDWDDRKSLMGPELTRMVLNSSVPIERLDDMVTRIVASWYKMGQDSDYPEPNFSSWTKDTEGLLYPGGGDGPRGVINQHIDVRANHAALARKVAADGSVLLKNDRNTLPLQTPMKIGIYGEGAAFPPDGPNTCMDRGCNKGTLLMGWGSGTVDLTDAAVEPLAAIRERAATYGGVVDAITDNGNLAGIAVSAKQQDVCIVFISADAGEAYITWEDVEGDRPNLNAQKNGDELVTTVANNCDNTIVIAHTVGPIVVEKWVNKRQVRSILWANLPGQEAGSSLVDLLWGYVNPSGKLAYTIGRSLEDYGPGAQIMYAANGNPPQQDFTDGLYIDYRHFDRENIQPRYEFGFGLSYTTFGYGQMRHEKLGSWTRLPAPRPAPQYNPPSYPGVIPSKESTYFPEGFTKINRFIYPYLTPDVDTTSGPYPYPEGYDTPGFKSEAGGAEGGNPALWEVLLKVTIPITNTGSVAGAEVVQLYTVPPKNTGIDFPLHQLRGFEKVFLQPGETQEVMFELTRRDLSYWDVYKQNWVLPSPGIGINVGRSSRKFEARGFVYKDRE